MQSLSPQSLTERQIVRLWWPLLLTWLMMAAEGPAIAALVARLPDPTWNLAAYGVAFAFALIFEAPIIMMLSASTALVRDRESYRRLRRYAQVLNLSVTIIAASMLWPPVFRWFAESLLDLPAEVSSRTYMAMVLLLPWPGAIGIRRFFQGIVIRDGRTRQIAQATSVRIATMFGTLILLSQVTNLDGAAIGAAALSVGVMIEAVAVRILAAPSVARVLAQEPAPDEDPLTVRRFTEFYTPLVLTSLLTLAIQPLVTFFVGRARLPIESLAVLPVVNAFVFIFRCVSLSMQEVLLTLLSPVAAARRVLRRFVLKVATGVATLYGAIAFTPLADLWLAGVSGLSVELATLSLKPLRISMLTPLISLLLTYQTAVAIVARRTKAISRASLVEVLTVALALAGMVFGTTLVGAVAAALALVSGRALGTVTLLWFNARFGERSCPGPADPVESVP